MNKDDFASNLRTLADFLTPTDKPDKLCHKWNHMAEDKDGCVVISNHIKAARFCVLGGYNHIFGKELILDVPDGFSSDSVLAHIFDEHDVTILGPTAPAPENVRKRLLDTAEWIKSL